jgi:Putative DNA-binding domain
MASLRELQHSFAAALRDPTAACDVMPPANLAIYRNNASIGFHAALTLTFPVLRRRVGEDYFRQLAHDYRRRFPSTSGDLHWVGREFAGFLDDHLSGEYTWLADLARLEWSRAECQVAVELPPISASALARFSAHEFEHLVFGLQPALKLHSSGYPMFTVWLANQSENAPPVDQSVGPEQGLVRPRGDSPEIRSLDRPLFSFLCALRAGLPLGEAVSESALDLGSLTPALEFVFNEGLVSSLTLSELDGQRVGTSS